MVRSDLEHIVNPVVEVLLALEVSPSGLAQLRYLLHVPVVCMGSIHRRSDVDSREAVDAGAEELQVSKVAEEDLLFVLEGHDNHGLASVDRFVV